MGLFYICLVVLIGGFFIYGGYVESCFKPPIDDRKTPAYRLEDDVDYVPMSTPRVFLIQLLNIAGLGPIFGAISGALWGPAVFLWITFGTIFAGAVHDFCSGLLSERNNGASIAEIIGKYCGNIIKQLMRFFSVLLLVMIGVLFTSGPAGLLTKIMPVFDFNTWLFILLIYYFLATFLPINKIIGRLYPIFGVCLIFMAVGVAVMLIVKGYSIPVVTFTNLHPKQVPIWPIMFITVACGAISGFHATQSPLMARCIKTERDAKKVFYGAMVCEGIIALVWAAAGCSFYHGSAGLQQALVAYKGPGGVVYDICKGLMGPIGMTIAMVGVIACPITLADTAFRGARYAIADWFKMEQKTVPERLRLCIPIILVAYALTQLDFSIVWRYTAWINQTLAMLVLWAGAFYLYANKGNFWICVIPATFMGGVCFTYILCAPEGLRLSVGVAYPIGTVLAIIGHYLFWVRVKKIKNGQVDLTEKALDGNN